MKVKVVILFGGESVEHEVSIISAIQAMNACDENKVEVIPVYVSKQRDFYYFDHIPTASEFKDLNEVTKKQPAVSFVKKGNAVNIEPINRNVFSKTLNTVDLVIPVMHGTNGEDGSVQGLLEMMKIPYAGCDVIAAGCGQDKVVMKYILEGYGLPICDWLWVYGHQAKDKIISLKNQINEKKMGYPLVIKPACLGSSVGICIAHNEDELLDKIMEAAQYDNKVVIEKMVQNLREINCSVMGTVFENRQSVLEEVNKGGAEILDFEKKYLGGGKNAKGVKGVKNLPVKNTTGSKSQGMASAARLVPAPISDEETTYIKSLAKQTFEALGASGVCRIDFMMDGTTEKIYVNEINTIPGSLAFYLWQEEGVDFTALMDNLISQAIDRQRRREKMITSFDSNILANYKG